MAAKVGAVPGADGGDGDVAVTKGSLQRSMSIKASAAADHYKEHKWKYIALKVVVGLAIGLGVGLGIVVALGSKSSTIAGLQARLAANSGVTIKPVTIIPAKGAKSSRRMLGSFLRRVLSATAIDPTSFPETSDYNVAGSPNYVVGDPSAQAATSINNIACYVAQLRVADIGLNTTENPKLLPYVALVNQKLCGSQPAMSTWFVKSQGPTVFGSDGLYITNGQIKDQGVYIQIENNIVGSAVSTSKIYFQVGGGEEKKGTLQMDFSNPSNTDVIFAFDMSANGSPVTQYLHATFNPSTFVGSAVSNAISGIWDYVKNKVVIVETKYALDFNQNQIKRRQQIGANSATSTCIDFSVASRILVGDRYTLYSALDGTALNFQSGFSVTHTFPQYAQPVDAYASFWGVYPSYGDKPNGESEDTSALWVDGLSVDKLNYDGSTSQLTLKLVNARLEKISRRTITLDTIKGLPLYVDTYNGGDSFAIAWDGSKFNVVARTIRGCWNNSAQDFVSLASGVSITKYSDCKCLVLVPGDNKYTVSTSASVSLSLNSYYYTDKGEASVTATPLSITSAQFPRGIRVRSKDYTLSGQIEIEYDSIQTLYGVKNQAYLAGGIIKQGGATGTVYKTTKNRIFGLTASPSISVAFPSQTTCDLPSSSSTEPLVRPGAMVYQEQFGIKSTIAKDSKTMGGSAAAWTAVSSSSFAGIKVGMMVTGTGIPDYTYVSAVDSSAYTITLSNAATAASASSAPNTFTFSVVAITRDYWGGMGGLSVDYFTPNNAASFDVSGVSPTALKVTMPPPDQRRSPLDMVTGYSGTLSWDSNSGLSTDWNSYPTITTASYSCGGTLSATVTGVTGASVGFWASSGTLYYVYVSSPGSSCTSPAVTFSCSSGDSGFVPPVVTGLACNRHIAAVSDSVIVLLSSPTATKFTAKYSPDGTSSTADLTVTYTPPGSITASSVGAPYWSNAESGDARLPSGSSLLVYQTKSVVMPGETVPELLCSSGTASCPQGAAVKYYPVFKASITKGSNSITITTASTTGVALTSPYTAWNNMHVQGTGIDPVQAAQKGYNKIVSCSSSTQCTLESAASATANDVTITGSNWAGSSSSSTNYGGPSHLNPSVTLVKPGTCKLVSGTAPPQGTATYANIGGSPVIKLDWDSGTVKSGGTYYSVSFMRLTDRGMGCSSSFTPTVTWAFDSAFLDCGSDLPTATMSCDSSSGSDISDFRQAYRYTFDSTTGALTDTTSSTGGLFVLDKNNWDLSTSTKSASFGPFFANTAANKALLNCDYDSSLGCGYKVYEELDTFYQYTTGTSSHAQRVSMVDAAGKTILFDQPMPLTYRHAGTTSNSRTKNYDGVLMMLQYNGPGDLQGFPQVCVDANMEVTQCVMYGNSATTSYPDITLPENVPITDLNGKQYYARAEEVSERYPKAADQTICNALTFASLPSVPDLSKLFVAPSNGNAPEPTDAELASNFLNAGKPEAVGGVTLYELKALAAAKAAGSAK